MTLFEILFGAMFIGGGGILLGSAVKHPENGGLFIGFIALLGPLMGAVFIRDAINFEVLIDEDSLEIRGIRAARRITRREILGRKRKLASGTPIITLVPRDTEKKPILIPLKMKHDEFLLTWLDSLPDLDQTERAADEAAIAERIGGQVSAESVRARLDRAKTISKILVYVTLAAILAPFLSSRTIAVSGPILFALPWVVLVLAGTSPRLYSFLGEPMTTHGDLLLPFIIPGAPLALVSMFGVGAVRYWIPVAASFPVGAALAFLSQRVSAKASSKANLILTGVLLSFYGFAAVQFGNALLDGSAETIYRAKIVRAEPPTVTVSAWGPEREERSLALTGGHKGGHPLGVGDTACVHMGRGALNFAWFYLTPCDDSPEASR
jgi:hypothetical protein